jgi:catechol 2,3-dioxygenase-like lactoylglutathione lyase family enzyme
MPAPIDFTQVKETCLYVANLQRTADFYHGLLDLPVIGRVEGRHVFFRLGSSVLLCFIAEATRADVHLPAHYGTGTLHAAFEVPAGQYAATRDAIRNLGIAIEHEHTWPTGHQSFYFRDPDGHCLEVVPTGMWDPR